MSEKALLAVVGPTGIGKTALGIQLAKHFNTEIVSADSRQFFKEMEIGTAVPSKEELEQAPHHFIQHKSIFEPYSVGDFEKEALSLLEDLFQKKDVVVMVGGSGLYVDAVISGLDEFPEVDPEIRSKLNRRLEDEGLESLQKELEQKDPEYYKSVDLENPHRLIRALEVCVASGKPFSSFLDKPRAARPFKSFYIGIDAPRETIYERINTRVDLMMEAGLLKEAENLYTNKDLNALQTVGYKELFEYIEGNCSLEFAISEIKKNTRRFAKRQLTWLRKNDAILWVPYNAEPEEVLRMVTDRLKTNLYA
ncbi:tRNA (adenosine(37)-N6)-dimethylallyltransferase MiaA [Flagellimonas marinaquae]|uniref:tRNA dimethylallyltransferase n=1 Tax=Flagellimonas aurea TaxID=2915619 RepID=A0ABS3G5Y6_9FLAO|nr:tRNA (adenosine(37)-N6)-dimethylallyltransferase MiaA [Allomuricauda aurea]MAO16983.1 tRNA (adenosine(37)-N6)-dimethylallyltransferase MiaA [Allomuricauda sp.]MBO0354266.1 tRNA (adenosine(37)-N6)-dimethylallyltransferase MiaA [Allomuricauda aurea]UBZ14087.1 tRNA (adenosine(37)-N6)-dimethylallyltransferase MiaA [Allomuricauda aquimarina]|tara:strand:+ start:128 stop:1051 length:924 start_codon:yes stop_codon:yes gene_type:complete